MAGVTIGGERIELACNALTPIVYSGAFRYTSAAGKVRAKDVNDGVSEIIEHIEEYGIPPMLPLMQFLWAFAKTADKGISDFNGFVGGLPVDVLDISNEEGWATPVMELVQANFFPSATNVASATAEDGSAEAPAGA